MKYKILFFASLFAPLLADMDSIEKEINDYKLERDGLQMKADLAGKTADRIMQQDWMEYRQELMRQEKYLQQVSELDEKIAELEKQKRKS